MFHTQILWACKSEVGPNVCPHRWITWTSLWTPSTLYWSTPSTTSSSPPWFCPPPSSSSRSGAAWQLWTWSQRWEPLWSLWWVWPCFTSSESCRLVYSALTDVEPLSNWPQYTDQKTKGRDFLRGKQMVSIYILSLNHVTVLCFYRWQWWSWPISCLSRWRGTNLARRLHLAQRRKEGGRRRKKTNMDWWTIWSLRVFLQWERRDQESSSSAKGRSLQFLSDFFPEAPQQLANPISELVYAWQPCEIFIYLNESTMFSKRQWHRTLTDL